MFHKQFSDPADHSLTWKLPTCAPSVLILFINMVLFDKHNLPKKYCKEYMYDGQETVQIILLAVAAACVPILLLGKPIAVMCMKKKPKAPVSIQ